MLRQLSKAPRRQRNDPRMLLGLVKKYIMKHLLRYYIPGIRTLLKPAAFTAAKI
jgi:hypothetical protein